MSVVVYLHHLGVALQEVQDLIRAGFRPRAPSLMMILEGNMMLKVEL
jgi:hypothetical protein